MRLEFRQRKRLQILDGLRGEAARITSASKAIAPEAAIDIEVFNTYPGLDTRPDSQAVAFVKSLTGANGTIRRIGFAG